MRGRRQLWSSITCSISPGLAVILITKYVRTSDQHLYPASLLPEEVKRLSVGAMATVPCQPAYVSGKRSAVSAAAIYRDVQHFSICSSAWTTPVAGPMCEVVLRIPTWACLLFPHPDANVGFMPASSVSPRSECWRAELRWIIIPVECLSVTSSSRPSRLSMC